MTQPYGLGSGVRVITTGALGYITAVKVALAGPTEYEVTGILSSGARFKEFFPFFEVALLPPGALVGFDFNFPAAPTGPVAPAEPGVIDRPAS